MIDMVTQLIVAYFDDFPMHRYCLSLSVFALVNRPGCIKRALTLQSKPFMLTQTPKIIGINDGVHSPRQRYSPEGIAVANTPIQKNRKNQQAFNPGRNVDNNLNNPHLLKYQEKSEILSTKSYASSSLGMKPPPIFTLSEDEG